MSPHPNFLVIGAPRCATTWLHAVLSSHPDVFMSRRKELHFFDRNFNKGIDWYASHFKHAGNATAIGEVTPDYFYWPRVPERIANTLDSPKLIAILRDPVERAISHYRYARIRGLTESPDEYLRRGRGVVKVGFYSRHLARYDDVLVLIMERATTHPEPALRRLARHLGVDPGGFRADVGRRNASAGAHLWTTLRRMAKSVLRSGLPTHRVPDIPEGVRTRLVRIYAPEVERMEEVVGPLPEWHH